MRSYIQMPKTVSRRKRKGKSTLPGTPQITPSQFENIYTISNVPSDIVQYAGTIWGADTRWKKPVIRYSRDLVYLSITTQNFKIRNEYFDRYEWIEMNDNTTISSQKTLFLNSNTPPTISMENETPRRYFPPRGINKQIHNVLIDDGAKISQLRKMCIEFITQHDTKIYNLKQDLLKHLPSDVIHTILSYASYFKYN